MTERRIRVVVVDDIPEARDYISKLLLVEDDIQVVATGASGVDAIALYEEYRPDVVTMCINMPVMDGLSATRAIVSEHPEAKILIFTALSDPASVELAQRSGAKGYVVKPRVLGGNLDELTTTIRHLGSAPSEGDEPPFRPRRTLMDTRPPREARSPLYFRTRVLAGGQSQGAMLRELGSIALEVRKFGEAYDAFTRAIELDPLDSWAWLGKSVAQSQRPGWEGKECEVYTYLTESLGLAENSTGLGVPPKDFVTEFALRAEEIIRRYSEGYCRAQMHGGSLQDMSRERYAVWGASPSEHAMRLAAKSRDMTSEREGIGPPSGTEGSRAEVLLDVRMHETRIRFYLSCAITLSWAVFPTSAGGCLIAELLPYWWFLRWRKLLDIRKAQAEARDGPTSRDPEHLARAVQTWLIETNAELATFRQQLDSRDLPFDMRFTRRMAQWMVEVLSDTRGYRNRILVTTPNDLLDVAAGFYPECASYLQLPLEAS